MSRRRLVSLLFVGVAGPVLDVGRAGAQAVEVAAVLGVVNVILEEHLHGQRVRLHDMFAYLEMGTGRGRDGEDVSKVNHQAPPPPICVHTQWG